ncbi:MAG: glycoside hydrolase family 1 protein [bacterium]|nr:glycoside hydrolase family 1 protein [bacterium]
MKEKILSFPERFLWGSSTSAHQTEGHNIHSDWWAWENSPARVRALRAQGKSPKDFRSGAACDFYNRYESDFDLVAKLNQNAFRLSLEWARIEPVEGQFDEQELLHYEKVLSELKRRNIKSFVTLHHFTLPQWFLDKGGFSKKQNVGDFERYARRVAERYSGLVDFWLTINEPGVYASHSYFFGTWPPQQKSFWTMLQVVNVLIAAHKAATAAIRQYSNRPISLAFHIYDLVSSSIFARLTRTLLHYTLNEYFIDRTAAWCDYLGVNYYGHSHVGVLGRRMRSASHHEVSDMGWGIHPEGFERVLSNLKKYSKPIYVTENGLADAADTRREKFIKDHLYYMHQAIEKGADVRGYLHWSLLDNFEWHHGFAPRFGLVAVDYKTQKRTIRNSALAYAEICRTNKSKHLPTGY